MKYINTFESSSIHSFGYKITSKELHIIFKSGGHYVFFDVPKKKYEGMIIAESKGKYFHKNIREKYSSDIIE